MWGFVLQLPLCWIYQNRIFVHYIILGIEGLYAKGREGRRIRDGKKSETKPKTYQKPARQDKWWFLVLSYETNELFFPKNIHKRTCRFTFSLSFMGLADNIAWRYWLYAMLVLVKHSPPSVAYIRIARLISFVFLGCDFMHIFLVMWVISILKRSFLRCFNNASFGFLWRKYITIAHFKHDMSKTIYLISIIFQQYSKWNTRLRGSFINQI